MFPGDDLVLNLRHEDTLLWRSNHLAVFTRNCPAGNPEFETNEPQSFPAIGFMRSAVLRTSTEGGSASTDLHSPNFAAFHDVGLDHSRQSICDEGDVSDWIALSPSLMREISVELFREHHGKKTNFLETIAPVSSRNYSRQRICAAQAQLNCDVDKDLEKELLKLVVSVFTSARSFWMRQVRRRNLRKSCEIQRQKLIRRVSEHMCSHFDSELHLQDLAAIGHCSITQLTRVFPLLTGYTVHGYQLQLRLRASLELLQQGKESVASIADQLGFPNHSHFSMAFKSHFDMTPSEYSAKCASSRVSLG